MVVFNINHDKEMKKYLEEHRLHVAAQIQKLKVLKVLKLNDFFICIKCLLTL